MDCNSPRILNYKNKSQKPEGTAQVVKSPLFPQHGPYRSTGLNITLISSVRLPRLDALTFTLLSSTCPDGAPAPGSF